MATHRASVRSRGNGDQLPRRGDRTPDDPSTVPHSPSSGPARSAVRERPRRGRQVDAGVAGPVPCRLAECSELVGVFVAATDVGELFDDVTELLDVDGVAASPATPQVERFDLSSQGSDVVDAVVELLAHVVAMQRRARSRRRVLVLGGSARRLRRVVAGCVRGVRSHLRVARQRRHGRGGLPVGRGCRCGRGGAGRGRGAATPPRSGSSPPPAPGEPEPSPPRSGRGRVRRRWPRLQVEPAAPRWP